LKALFRISKRRVAFKARRKVNVLQRLPEEQGIALYISAVPFLMSGHRQSVNKNRNLTVIYILLTANNIIQLNFEIN
jgi:hypothetical protein